MESSIINLTKNKILLGILMILFTNLASAHFICGIVDDSPNMSSMWFDVRVYYPQNPSDFSTCEVSPAENKYCCDVEAIKYRKWKAGDLLFAEIYDNKTDYFAAPVSIETTGEGYDVMPNLSLQKVIDVVGPTSKLINTSNPQISFNINLNGDYSNFTLSSNNEQKFDCQNCPQINETLNLSYGSNQLKFIAKKGSQSYSLKKDMTILSSINLSRDFNNGEWEENLIKTGRTINVTLNLSLSHPIENLSLTEYVHKDFAILETDAIIENSSEEYYKLTWDISGTTPSLSYTIVSPFVFLFPSTYAFKTDLEDLRIDESNVTVYRFFSFFSTTQYPESKDTFQTNAKPAIIDKRRPLVIYPEDSLISKAALFPNDNSSMAYFHLDDSEDSSEDLEDLMFLYDLKGSLSNENINRTYFELKIPSNALDDKEYLYLLYKINNSWQQGNLLFKENDSEFYYFNSTVTIADKIALIGKEKGFLRKLISTFD